MSETPRLVGRLGAVVNRDADRVRVALRILDKFEDDHPRQCNTWANQDFDCNCWIGELRAVLEGRA